MALFAGFDDVFGRSFMAMMASMMTSMVAYDDVNGGRLLGFDGFTGVVDDGVIVGAW